MVGIAVVAVVLFIAWRAWVAFAPIQAGPLPPPPTQDINFVMQKSVECQGDFGKLSAADQAKVQQITHGWGPSAIAADWRKSQSKQP
jgi:hypothetical protein